MNQIDTNWSDGYALTEHYAEMYPPHMGLFVGDRPEDEECARLAGFTFVPADVWRAVEVQP